MPIDLLIRNGHVADGTAAPGLDADVEIDDGRIAGHGRFSARGREGTDTQGLVVTPGFIDMRTHLDARLGGTRCCGP